MAAFAKSWRREIGGPLWPGSNCQFEVPLKFSQFLSSVPESSTAPTTRNVRIGTSARVKGQASFSPIRLSADPVGIL